MKVYVRIDAGVDELLIHKEYMVDRANVHLHRYITKILNMWFHLECEILKRGKYCKLNLFRKCSTNFSFLLSKEAEKTNS